MTERAEVLGIDGRTVTVRCATVESCSGCAGLFCNPRVRTYPARIDARTAGFVTPGAFVEVDIPSSGAIWKGMMLFGLPLLLFAAFYLLLGFTESEVVRAAGGFGGLAIGLAASVAVGRLWSEPMPVVLQVYGEPQLVPVDVPARS